MFKLILNEQTKIYKRKSSLIMILLLIAITVFVTLYTNKFAAPDSLNWQKTYEAKINQYNETLKAEHLPASALQDLLGKIKIYQYALDNNIPPSENTLWGAVKFESNAIALVSLFTIVIAGGIVSSEFTRGTIKLLLIRPVGRHKILLSKYVAVLNYGLLLLLLLFGVSFITNGLLYGFTGADSPYLYIGKDGNVLEQAMLTYVLHTYLLRSVEILIYASLAFMLSTVSRSTALAIGVSIAAYSFGPQFNALYAYYKWIKYLLFINTDLTRINIYGLSLHFSLAVLATYSLLFTVIAWTAFIKRDVSV